MWPVKFCKPGPTWPLLISSLLLGAVCLLRQMGFSHILPIARPMKLQVRKVLCKRIKNVSHIIIVMMIKWTHRTIQQKCESQTAGMAQFMNSSDAIPTWCAGFLRSLLLIWLVMLPRWTNVLAVSIQCPYNYKLRRKKMKERKKQDLFLSDFRYFLAWPNYWVNNSLSIITAAIPGDIGKEPWNTIGESNLMHSTAKGTADDLKVLDWESG